MVNDRLIENLQELGFSLYEARVYLGLLAGGPQNGNELSRMSGVPSSKVYPTLERLATDGIVASSRRGNTVEYVCVHPRDLLHKLRERYERPLTYLEERLPEIAHSEPGPDLLHLDGLDAVFDHARALIRSGRQSLYLSVWQEHAEVLQTDLEEAEARGVRIAGMLYGAELPDVGWWQRHSYQETVGSRIGGRMLTVVCDGREALIAHMPDIGAPSGVRTNNPVLCLVAEEYMIHDLTLQKAKTMTGYEEWDRWLRSDDQVRAITLGRTGHLSPIEPQVGTT
jgi:sugar-specific transcriptional regulator TrmB